MAEEPDKIICPNCEKEFDSSFNYCPHCGQKNIDPDPKLKHFISEFLSANFNIDSKIFITLKALILKPALLSKEFLAGKREKYLTPVRLYLLISLVYFFIISIAPDDNSHIVGINDTEVVDSDSSNVVISIDSINPDTLTEFDRTIYDKVKFIETPAGKKIFMEKLKKNISWGMFIFIPLTAFIFFLLFIRKTKYYIPNLIFTLHLQSLIFLWFTIFSIIGFFFDFTILNIAELILIFYLTFLWIKSFYEISISKTIRKMFLFFCIYFIILLIFMGTVMGLSFWFIK